MLFMLTFVRAIAWLTLLGKTSEVQPDLAYGMNSCHGVLMT